MRIPQARILEWAAIALLQGIFPAQGSNPGLPHYRQILYHLSHQGSLETLTMSQKLVLRGRHNFDHPKMEKAQGERSLGYPDAGAHALGVIFTEIAGSLK